MSRRPVVSRNFFYDVFGFQERDNAYEMTRKILFDRATFRNCPSAKTKFQEKCIFEWDGKRVDAGTFSFPSVGELRQLVRNLLSSKSSMNPPGNVCVQNITGSVRELHLDPQYQGATFQCASQFNLLEFTSPSIIPECGIQVYEFDHTQGPQCAIACAAGTAYRNYLVPVSLAVKESEIARGQTRDRQLNGLADWETHLQREHSISSLWEVRNGYTESSAERLQRFNEILEHHPDLADILVSKLRVGWQEDTTVTDIHTLDVTVNQVYCSAISVGYSDLRPLKLWERMARLVLEATYEATLLISIIKNLQTSNNLPVLLTKVGGGVFSNDDRWIQDAIQISADRVKEYGVDLDIRIVHYGRVDEKYLYLERLMERSTATSAEGG